MLEALREYAKAYLSYYEGREIEAYETLCDISKIVNEKDIYDFFSYPWIGKNEKKKVIENAFFDETIRNFLFVLVDNERISDIGLIKDEVKSIIDSIENRKNVIAYSRSPLTEEYKSKLSAKLEKIIGSKIELRNEIDEKIIAGVRIAYDSKEIDMTLNSRMEGLISSLKE